MCSGICEREGRTIIEFVNVYIVRYVEFNVLIFRKIHTFVMLSKGIRVRLHSITHYREREM